MPSITRPYTSHYEATPPTKENLDYADLAIIDLSKANTPEGRAALASEVCRALNTTGFFYVVGHGYTQEETDRMFDIANVPFSQVSDEEKQAYLSKIKETGTFQGYKLRNYWHIDNGVPDQIEFYAINRDVTKKPHPAALRPFLPEIKEFSKFNHEKVLYEILRFLAIGLELPEETLVNLHRYEAVGASHAWFMKYYPRSEEEVKAKNVWLKGHTDLGSMTILWSQPVAALHMLSPDGKWRWVKHIPNALIVNSSDTMEFLSGGYYKATIHRVVQPPPDQRTYERVGMFYFCVADDDVRLNPLVDSPVLQRVGIERRFADSEAPTMEEWRKARTSSYGVSKLMKEKSGHEIEIVSGIEVKHYN